MLKKGPLQFLYLALGGSGMYLGTQKCLMRHYAPRFVVEGLGANQKACISEERESHRRNVQ